MARTVKLRIYDLSNGLAKVLSLPMIGREIDGVWHTGVVVGDTEYFFGQGIQKCRAHESPFSQLPNSTMDMGLTEVPDSLIQDFLEDVTPRFNAMTYNLLTNNCNNFSNELVQFLVGKEIPAYITGLPAEVASTPFGQNVLQMIMPALQERFSHATAAGFPTGTESVEDAIRYTGKAAHINVPPASSMTSPPRDEVRDAQEYASPSAQGGTDVKVNSDTGDGSGAGVSATSGREALVEGAAVQKAFQAALADEFFKVQAEGIADRNQAGAEAVKRVMIAVRAGLVLPPVQVQQPQGQRVLS